MSSILEIDKSVSPSFAGRQSGFDLSGDAMPPITKQQDDSQIQNGNLSAHQDPDCIMCTPNAERLQMQPVSGRSPEMVALSHSPTIQPMIQRQEEEQHEEAESEAASEEEGMTWEEIREAVGEAILSHPPTLSGICEDRMNEVAELLRDLPEYNRYYSTVVDIYNGYFGLAFDLRLTEGETTGAQRERFAELQNSWQEVQQNIEDDIIRRINRNLRNTRRLLDEIKLQLVLVYRQVYLSGEDDTTEIVISETNEETTTLRGISDQVTGLLSAINDADAALTGRQVAPVLTVLSRANQFLNLILGWNFTGELDSASQSAFDDLQNGLAVALTAASFTAAAQYLPLFGHIPVLLGAISQQWDRVVEGLRSQNTTWWEAFRDMPYCSEEPGGCETLNYMISVFEASSWENVSSPPEEAADFFVDRREMFNTVARQVMETGGVPTESEYLIFTVVDDESFKPWVYLNREWIWKLIYGERSFPERD